MHMNSGIIIENFVILLIFIQYEWLMNEMEEPMTGFQRIMRCDENNKLTFVNAYFGMNSFWVTISEIALLFEVSVSSVLKHLSDLYQDRELNQEDTCISLETTKFENGHDVTRVIDYYNMSVIISIAFRLDSDQAVMVRRWALNALSEYNHYGYVMKEEHFSGSDYFNELMERIREIRASEKRAYQKIIDIFVQCSADFDKSSQSSHKFYSIIQNKLHFAVTGHTAAEIVFERVDADKPGMGLTSWKAAPDGKISAKDVVVAKNYLNEAEISRLKHIVSMLIDHAELMAEQQIKMSMENWLEKLDEYLEFSHRPVLKGKGRISREMANRKAFQEFRKFCIKQKRLS